MEPNCMSRIQIKRNVIITNYTINKNITIYKMVHTLLKETTNSNKVSYNQLLSNKGRRPYYHFVYIWYSIYIFVM